MLLFCFSCCVLRTQFFQAQLSQFPHSLVVTVFLNLLHALPQVFGRVRDVRAIQSLAEVGDAVLGLFRGAAGGAGASQ